MKALSIRQPWAYQIVHCGKDIENRSWYTGYRGLVLIHAGKSPDYPVADWPPDVPADAARGGIIGMARIVGCVRESDSPWFDGPFGFVLADPRPLPFQACRGQLGFFTPDIDYSRLP